MQKNKGSFRRTHTSRQIVLPQHTGHIKGGGVVTHSLHLVDLVDTESNNPWSTQGTSAFVSALRLGWTCVPKLCSIATAGPVWMIMKWSWSIRRTLLTMASGHFCWFYVARSLVLSVSLLTLFICGTLHHISWDWHKPLLPLQPLCVYSSE